MSDQLHLDEKFFEADQIIKEGKIAQALGLLTEVITESPEHGRSHNHLGWIYETKYNDYVKAEKHYKAALAFSPEYPAIYYNYSILLSTLNRYDDLTALLEKAMALPGINKATIYNEYGIMYEAQEKFNEAIEAFQNNIRHLYDTKLIDTARNSIERCKMKMQMKGQPVNNTNTGTVNTGYADRRRD
ncbi:MAG TPA: hypothetical protein VK177_13685 [Flavobacteriales bacterium]|nr:hypothetical protein [Flavobacteriales bacterium]